MNPANSSSKPQLCDLAAEESSESCSLLASSSEMNPTTTATKHQSSASHEESPDANPKPPSTSEIEESPPGPESYSDPEGSDDTDSTNSSRGSSTNSSRGSSTNSSRGSRSVPSDERSNFVKTITAIFDRNVPAISIFKVPDSLASAKPEAYAPKLVGFGPVHHSRRELQQMQMYKVMKAKRIHNGFKSELELDRVIKFLNQIVGGPSIRASYCIYLDMDDDDLACVMAVDGLFLFDLLCCHGRSEGALANIISSSLVDSVGRRLAQKTIIQEAMMLENQIPMFLMKGILIIECCRVTEQKVMEIVGDLFPKMLLGFCEYISPLKVVENYPLYKALKHAHSLDLLYHLVTLKDSPERNAEEEAEELRLIKEQSEEVRDAIPRPVPACCKESPYVDSTQIISDAINVAGLFVPEQFTKPLKLAGSLFDELPRFRSLISSLGKEEAPTKKIFLFPTASELKKVGVQFSVVDRITNISFDPEKASFQLPFIRLNGYFEVIIRNLVAYEAMIISEEEPPILNWYVELMNGLIETAEDVNVLRGQGIISKRESIEEENVTEGNVSKPESIDDEQVAKIFSGMNKSVELINIPDDLDKAIRGVKKYYTDAIRSASESTFMEKCRQIASKWCRVFAVLLALFLLTVQTVCSVYECPRFSFKTSNIITPQAQQGLQLPSLRSHLM